MSGTLDRAPKAEADSRGSLRILLDVQGSNIWSGQQVQSFNSQAVTWGALADSMYAPGTKYFSTSLSFPRFDSTIRPLTTAGRRGDEIGRILARIRKLSLISPVIPMAIIIGLFVPVPFWIAHKFLPKLGADKVVTPIVSSFASLLLLNLSSSRSASFSLTSTVR